MNKRFGVQFRPIPKTDWYLDLMIKAIIILSSEAYAINWNSLKKNPWKLIIVWSSFRFSAWKFSKPNLHVQCNLLNPTAHQRTLAGQTLECRWSVTNELFLNLKSSSLVAGKTKTWSNPNRQTGGGSMTNEFYLCQHYFSFSFFFFILIFSNKWKTHQLDDTPLVTLRNTMGLFE